MTDGATAPNPTSAGEPVSGREPGAETSLSAQQLGLVDDSGIDPLSILDAVPTPAEMRRAVDETWSSHPVDPDGWLDALTDVIRVFAERHRAIEEGRVAPPKPRVHTAPPPPDEDKPDPSIRRDTVVMDTEAIRAFVDHETPAATDMTQVEAEPALPSDAPDLPPPPPPSAEPVGPSAPPGVPADAAKLAAGLAIAKGSDWTPEVERLYDDTLFLFQNHDTEGGLISLERLSILAPEHEDIRQFMSMNADKLLRLYESVMGPWSRVLFRASGRTMPPAYTLDPKIQRILSEIDGLASVSEIFGRVALPQIETAAVISQLLRARMITLEEPDVLH